MLRFECDYAEGVHPRILDAMIKTNKEQTPGYGLDDYCETARKIIRIAGGNEDMDVHFLVGGTQANATVIAAALRCHQAVLSAETGHIAGHETGAIEATGHKVIGLPSEDGKITAQQVRRALDEHWSDESHEHLPQPAMVYISQPTETGTIYKKRELTELRRVCSDKNLILYLDGARLGYALAAKDNDVYMADLSRLCDVYYIGGTKVGAMFGEAVCIVNESLKTDFRYCIKQHGGMLAKGRFLGIQFETLFRDGLYLEISRSAVNQAMRIKDAFREAGCEFLFDSPTNQQFPIIGRAALKELSKLYSFTPWKKLPGERTAVRFVTSWATKDENVDTLVADIKRIFSLYGERPPVEAPIEPQPPEEPEKKAAPAKRRKL
ncbi:MAG: aminotransferase class I/II-fold pyridoxal phosphate-dependent enzyme [Oscillospiraceae bacterium]